MTPRARRLKGYIEGFTLLHHIGPTYKDICSYMLTEDVLPCIGPVKKQTVLLMLIDELARRGEISVLHGHFKVIEPCRTRAFAFTPTPDAKTWGAWNEHVERPGAGRAAKAAVAREGTDGRAHQPADGHHAKLRPRQGVPLGTRATSGHTVPSGATSAPRVPPRT